MTAAGRRAARPRSLELFAGAGGLALGISKAGFETVALVENDRDCVATLRRNRPRWNVMGEDVAGVDFRGMEADLVTGGFPCQPFSHAGHKLGFRDVRGTIFYEFARAVKEVRPRAFLAENVEAITRNDGGRTLSTILDILGSLGYRVEYRTLNALDYRVPQKRKRVIFVGVRRGVRFEFPAPRRGVVTMAEALRGAPRSEGEQYSEWRRKILDRVPPGGSWVDLPLRLQKRYLGSSFHSEGGKRGMARRLSWDEPCLTLTCSPAQKMTDRVHPDETRPLTVREYARIQTFPDAWGFEGSMHSQYRQIGNAVPVRLAVALGRSLRRALNA